MSANAGVSIEELRGALSYDSETGHLTWLVKKPGRIRTMAGGVNSRGYVVLSFNGRQLKATRVAWALHYGKWPDGVIDHINHDKQDNRLCNLRDVSVAVNTQNQVRAMAGSRSSLLGVFPAGSRWASKLVVNGRRVYLGVFATPEEAHSAYVEAKRLHHDGCTL